MAGRTVANDDGAEANVKPPVTCQRTSVRLSARLRSSRRFPRIQASRVASFVLKIADRIYHHRIAGPIYRGDT